MPDLAALVEPLASDPPSGEDLRLTDTTFSQLEDMARVVAPDEDVYGGEGKEADWQGIERLAASCLETRSKDLQLAAWVALARLRRQGFDGLAEGVDLMRELLDRFWDTLHPGPDPDDGSLDAEYRAMPIAWLDQQLAGASGRIGALENVPLVPRPGSQSDGQKRALSWQDRRRASEVDKYAQDSPEHYQELLDAGRVSTQQWTEAVRAADRGTLASTYASLQHCEEAIAALRATCEARFGEDDTPGLFRASSLLSEIGEYLAEVSRPPEAEEGAALEEGVAGEAAPAAGPQGALKTRAAAVARLAEVATFFRRTEPHSPVSFLVERAVRWANMPFEELMRDYIKDETTLGQVWETLGIHADESENG